MNQENIKRVKLATYTDSILFSSLLGDYYSTEVVKCKDEAATNEFEKTIANLKAELSQCYNSYEKTTYKDLKDTPSHLDSLTEDSAALLNKVFTFVDARSFGQKSAYEEYAEGKITFKVLKNVPKDMSFIEIDQITPENFKVPKISEKEGDVLIPTQVSADNDQVLIDLVKLKNIFSTQLPRMPKEYVVRVLFDPYHSVFGMWRNGLLIGGIAFRPFHSRNFAEIVFCAITNTEQVKGNGSLMMNFFKEHVKTKKISALLTYADNFAIGFFQKQGFTNQCVLNKDTFNQYIKNYDGSCLMECILYDEINYINIKDKANEYLKEFETDNDRIELREVNINHDFKWNGEDKEKNKQIFVKKMRELANTYSDNFIMDGAQEIDLVDEDNILCRSKEMKVLSAKLAALLKRISSSNNAWPFLKPVDRKQVVDYYDVITIPVDIGSIRKYFSEGKYKSKEEFEADVNLIFSNCRKYNSVGSNYVRCANLLEQEVKKWVAELFN